MFSYTQPGQVAGKRLRVTKVQPYLNGLNHTQTAVGDLNLAYAYNYEGQMTRVTYPTDAYGTTPLFNYSFDQMMRPAGMTDQNSASVVSGATYGPANELKQMTYSPGTETRTYNSMLQLTNITGVNQGVTYQNISYTFPVAGQNAGKILSQTDSISGETVSYVYDSLKRLTSATANANAWQQTYSYDGFGNLTGRMGYGAAQSTTINTPADPITNRLSGYTYDPNGNQISTGYAYDAENRLVQANAGAVRYGYDGQNKRIWQATFSNCSGDSCMSSDSISIFGIDGKQIGTYTAGAAWNNTQTQIALSFYSTTQRVYFGRKLVATLDYTGTQHGMVQDRLSSVGKYYPFGEERNSPPLANDNVKFAGYTRDSATGLDYADQRHYASTFGRFMTSDQYQASGGPSDPQSWNRYAYTRGDPVNANDPNGRFACFVDGLEDDCGSVCSGLNGGLYLIGTGSGDGNIGMTIPCGDWGIGIGLILVPGGVGVDPPPKPPSPPPPDPRVLCEALEAAYLTGYLSSHGSPLAAYALEIVQASDMNGIDDRFIVALAGIESGYGEHLGWGPYNAWNNGAHRSPRTFYSNWIQSIGDVTFLLGNDPRYTPYDSTADIYSVYEEGNINQPAPRQGKLDQIYGNQLGGDLSDVRIPRCPRT
jgi:RHS repeat-associated protein